MDLLSEFISHHKDDFWAHSSEVRRQNFVNKYTNEVILGLAQEEYNYAGREDTFCFRIQRDLACLASMGNAFPSVFGVYVNLDHRVRLSRNLESMFGTDFAGALKYQKEQIVSLINAGKEQDYRYIENSHINQQFKFKILSVYHPDIYFPVCTRPAAEGYCNAFGIKYSSYSSMLDLVVALSTWSRNNLPEDWGLNYGMSFADWLWKTGKSMKDSASYADSVITRVPTKPISQSSVQNSVVSTASPKKATQESAVDYAQMFPKGCRIEHISFGKGMVESTKEGIITAKFKGVGIKALGAEACVKMNLIKRI